ncbi:MAG: serine/threonine-protein phosphatase, partial [Acidobacteriaceae bacterium]|nr:serine/threonine-protein phosphatase [Acidobacteriaceae bacterium]
APLIAAPQRRDAAALQTLGKHIMDEFRGRDDDMQRTLQRIAVQTDDTLTRTLGWLIGFGIIAELGVFAFGLTSSLAAERAERQRRLYENEKRIADTLQAAFFQPSLPQLPQLGLHGSYVPAEEHTSIGGDWYDAFIVREGQLFFSIGDVTGHGLDAAVTMSRARQSLIVNAMRESDPAKILEWTNNALVVQADRIVTAICGFVDLRSLEIRYATAGHPPPVMAHVEQPARFLSYGGLPLAVERYASFETFREGATGGALLVLYTDGLIEYKRNLSAAETQLLSVADEIVQSGQIDDPSAFIRTRFFEQASPADDVAVLAISFRQLIPDRPPEALLSAVQVAGGRVEADMRP